jgi:dolichyl-diphosphooligosaccharide--protein glycosyltransferase
MIFMKSLKEFDFRNLGNAGFWLKFLKSNYVAVALLIILLLALQVRMLPGYNMQYPRLQHEADCYLIFRLGESIIENGYLTANDTYIGYGTLLAGFDHTKGHFVTYYTYPVFYWLLNPLFGVSFYWVAIWMPAFLGMLQVLFMFLFAKELFGKRVGLLSAAFLAVSPGVLFRVSAGFIEKEPIGGVLMMMGLWLFAKSFKVGDVKRSVFHHIKLPFMHPEGHKERIRIARIVTYGVLAGFTLAIMSAAWGGIKVPMLVIGIFAFFALMINRYSPTLFYSYMATFLSFFIFSRPFAISPHMNDIEIWSSFVVVGLMLLRYGAERFRLVKKEYLPYIVPAAVCVGLIGLGVYVYVDVEMGEWFGGLMQTIQTPLTSDVIGSTVAESQSSAGFIANSVSSFGTDYAISAYRLPELLRYFSVFYFALFGVMLMLYLYIFRNRSYDYIFMLVFFALCGFVATSTVRLTYVMGFPVAIIAAFFVVKASEYVIRNTGKVKVKKEYMTAVIGILVGIMLITNYASAFVVSASTTPGLEEEWYQAMLWLKDNTNKSDVTLEWRDYGYWFQYVAQRRTITDGGYHNRYPLQRIAKFYTDPVSNESLKLLKEYSVDYVMVSPDLIPKFGAMSKIANWGSKVDVMPVFSLTNRYQEGGKTLLEYSLGGEKIIVAFTTITEGNQTSLGNMTAVIKSGMGQAYIRDIGVGNQVIRTPRENSMPGMVYMAGNAVIFIPEAIEECGFVRLYLFDGAGLESILEKVYDNMGIKIFKVNYKNFPPIQAYNPNIPLEDVIE